MTTLRTNDHVHVQRLRHVLNEAWRFTQEGQLDLADMAVLWLFASLASHPECDRCCDGFFSLVDDYYIDTDDGRQTLNERERQTFQDAAVAGVCAFREQSGRIFQESKNAIMLLDENHIYRLIAQSLLEINGVTMEHAPPPHLTHLTLACCLCCCAVPLVRRGVTGYENELHERLGSLMTTILALQTAFAEEINAGRILVKNGEVIHAWSCDHEIDDDLHERSR